MIMLVSDGIESIIKYYKTNKNEMSQKKLGIIPSSKTSRKYLEPIIKDYYQLNVKDCTYIDIFELSTEQIYNLCLEMDILHLSGGDTVPFIKHLQTIEFEKVLNHYTTNNKTLIGMSAGGILMSSTLQNLFDYSDEDTLPNINDKTYGIFNYAFYPHSNNAIKFSHKPRIICPDGGLVIIHDNSIDCYFESSVFE